MVGLYHTIKRILGALGLAALVAGALRISGRSQAPVTTGGWTDLTVADLADPEPATGHG